MTSVRLYYSHGSFAVLVGLFLWERVFQTSSSACILPMASRAKRIATIFFKGQQPADEVNDKTTLSHTRRRFLRHTTILTWFTSSVVTFSPAFASQDSSDGVPVEEPIPSKRPFAPPEALMPAVRVKLTIDRCVELAKAIEVNPKDIQENKKRQEELQGLLLTPQEYIGKSVKALELDSGNEDVSSGMMEFLPTKSGSSRRPRQEYHPAKAYLETYDSNRQRLPLVFQPGALMVQSGEIDFWRRLKRDEAQQESQDAIRAALNTYTKALTYRADAYLLTVSEQQRSQMIRQDKLPDVKQVIASDLGLRYLYRNQLLTSMSEAKAELEFQLKQEGRQLGEGSSSIDVSELLRLLYDSQTACSQWFSLIDPDQVKQAIELVKQENEA